MPRRKTGDIAVKSLQEVKDLASEVQKLNKGVFDTKAGYEGIVNTVEMLSKAQEKSAKWQKATVDAAKQQAEHAKAALKLGTKRWWMSKSMAKTQEVFARAGLNAKKREYDKAVDAGKARDETIEGMHKQVELSYEGLGLAGK